jgi:hypothetical protein
MPFGTFHSAIATGSRSARETAARGALRLRVTRVALAVAVVRVARRRDLGGICEMSVVSRRRHSPSIAVLRFTVFTVFTVFAVALGADDDSVADEEDDPAARTWSRDDSAPRGDGRR